MKRHHRGAERFTYHPFEVALCGYSGAGKTTLAARLLRRWASHYRVGFVKHDAHRFEMDRPGKDTFLAREAGAAAVMINDPRQHARVSMLHYSAFERAYSLFDTDFVLAEGFKHSDLPKLLLLDGEGRAWDEYRQGRFSNVQALVGAVPAPEGLVEIPFLHRDDVDAIAAFIEDLLHRQADAPLYGLVLAGGESRRMGRPKWALTYHGEPQSTRTARLLGSVCERVFLSVREGQEVAAGEISAIPDRFPPWGPAAGILSAMEAYPQAAWLVTACDLPFLDEQTLHMLAEARAPFQIGTAFNSARDGLPEPLCAIWEPRARQRLLQATGMGMTCPRRVLIESRPHLLDLPNPQALVNVNTADEYEQALTFFREG